MNNIIKQLHACSQFRAYIHSVTENFDESKMTTLPSPPFVDIPGIANFRDIAGQIDNVRAGLVYRSADPSKPTQDGLEKMRDLGR